MEEEKTNRQSGVGVAALVTGIIAFLMAVVPCVGIIAFMPAVIAMVLAIVGLSRPRSNQGILIGGLVVGDNRSYDLCIADSFVIGKDGDKQIRRLGYGD